MNNVNSKEFIAGLLLGGVAGGISALLYAPKSGEDLRHDIYDQYHNLENRVKDLAGNAASKGQYYTDKINSYTKKGKNYASSLAGYDEENQSLQFLLGGLVGGLLGALGAFLFAPKGGKQFRRDIKSTYHDLEDKAGQILNFLNKKGKKFTKNMDFNANEWTNRIKDFADNILDELEEWKEETAETARQKKSQVFNENDRIHQIADWLSFGLNAWQKLKR